MGKSGKTGRQGTGWKGRKEIEKSTMTLSKTVLHFCLTATFPPFPSFPPFTSLPSRNPEKLMRLQAEPPAWMGQAVSKRRRGVGLARRSVHRLQEEVAELKTFESLRLRAALGINQLDLVAAGDNQPGLGLGTHTEPIDPIRGCDGAVGLDRYLEPFGMQRIQKSFVELEERLPPGADHEAAARLGPGPGSGHRCGQLPSRTEFSSTRPIGTEEIGVTELTGCVVAVLLPPGPQITAGKTAEHRRPSGVGAFALQGVEDLFDVIGHCST